MSEKNPAKALAHMYCMLAKSCKYCKGLAADDVEVKGSCIASWHLYIMEHHCRSDSDSSAEAVYPNPTADGVSATGPG